MYLIPNTNIYKYNINTVQNRKYYINQYKSKKKIKFFIKFHF